MAVQTKINTTRLRNLSFWPDNCKLEEALRLQFEDSGFLIHRVLLSQNSALKMPVSYRTEVMILILVVNS